MIRDPETLGDRLLLLRSMANLKTFEVADKLKLTTREYLLFEEGKGAPDYFMLRRMMALHGVTSDYLLFGIMLGLRQELFRRLTRFITKEEQEAIIYSFEDDESHWKSEGALK